MSGLINNDNFEFPKVSVIIPSYNSEAFIKRCIESLKNQNYPKDQFEIIIVDNNSTDNTAKISRSFGIKYLENKNNQSPASSRNIGIKASNCDIIIFTDADCIAPKNFIITHVTKLLELRIINPDYIALAGGIKGYNGSYWAICDDICSWLFFNYKLKPRYNLPFAPTANLSIFTSYLQEIGYFDETMRYSEDVYFCKKIRSIGKKIFFEPDAYIEHINKISYKEFINHRVDWGKTRYYELISKKCTPDKNPVITFTFKFIFSIIAIILYCLKAKKYYFILFLPFIIVGQTIYFLTRLKIELQYKKGLFKKL